MRRGFRVGNLFSFVFPCTAFFCRKYLEIMSDNVVVRWLCHEDIAVNSESILCSSHYKVPLAIHYLNASVD